MSTAFGEDLPLICALELTSMDVREEVMEITTSTQSWVANSPLSTHNLWNTEELKLKQSCLREIGFGPQSGCFQETTSTENGPPVARLTSWKAEETLDILKNLEEDPTPSDRLCIGVPTSSPISFRKLMLKQPLPVVLLLTTSILSVSIGTIRSSTPTLITTPTKCSQLTTLLKAIGTNQASQTDLTLGNTQRTRMLPSINHSTWSSTWQSEAPMDILRMELLLSPGLIILREPLQNSTTTRDNGGQPGETRVPSKSIASLCGTFLLTLPKKNPNPSSSQTWSYLRPNND